MKLLWMLFKRAVAGTFLVACAATAPVAGAAEAPQLYLDSIRTSQYVTVRDGTRLAIDIYRPAVGGKPVDTKLPVILVATPYHRSSENNNEILTFLAAQAPIAISSPKS